MRSEFGERLYEARKSAGLTQAALAKSVGMSQPTYSDLEKNGQGSSYTSAIANKCGVVSLWLETGDGPKFAAAANITAPSPRLTATGSESKHPLANIDKAQEATNDVASIERLMADLATYLEQMDDYARDNAADVLRRLTTKPEEHARAAALFSTAFQSGKRKAA